MSLLLAPSPAGLSEHLHGFKDLKEFVQSLQKPRWACAKQHDFIVHLELLMKLGCTLSCQRQCKRTGRAGLHCPVKPAPAFAAPL